MTGSITTRLERLERRMSGASIPRRRIIVTVRQWRQAGDMADAFAAHGLEREGGDVVRLIVHEANGEDRSAMFRPTVESVETLTGKRAA